MLGEAGGARPGGSRRASGRPIIAEMRREYAEGCNQDALRLLLAHRLPTPALAQRPLTHAALQPDHVPHAAPGRAAEPAERPQRRVDPPPHSQVVLAGSGSRPVPGTGSTGGARGVSSWAMTKPARQTRCR